MTTIYLLYNNIRLNILFDINSKRRIESILNNIPEIIGIKLTDIDKFNLNNIKTNKDIIIIESSSIPVSTHNFPKNKIKSYNKFLTKFNKKVILFEDMHRHTYGTFAKLFYCLKKYGIYYFTSFYKCNELDIILNNHKWINTTIIYHHFEGNIFRDYKLEKKYDIVFYGDAYPTQYPFRYRIKKLLTDLQKLSNIRIKIIKRPTGYFLNNKFKMNNVRAHRIELAKIINSSWLTVATCSKYDYLVCKYFEICGAKSTILGNCKSKELCLTNDESLFEDNMIHIDECMSDYDIIKTIVLALRLQNRKNLRQMQNNMYSIVHNNYTIEKHYPKKLLEFINKIDIERHPTKFIHIPKNGGMSVGEAIKNINNIEYCNHSTDVFQLSPEQNTIIVIY